MKKKCFKQLYFNTYFLYKWYSHSHNIKSLLTILDQKHFKATKILLLTIIWKKFVENRIFILKGELVFSKASTEALDISLVAAAHS